MYLALNNLQWLICHKTQINQTLSIYTYILVFSLVTYYFYLMSSWTTLQNLEDLVMASD